MDRDSIFSELYDIQQHVKLKEGLYGLIRFIACLGRHSELSTKQLSQHTNFPVPICVAIRNEFEKKGWCKRISTGTQLTEIGLNIVSTLNPLNEDFSCSECNGEGFTFPLNKYKKELEALDYLAELRGSPDTTIDQSYATPETSLLRVLLMGSKYDLFYKNYALVGDSDLTSVALSFLTPASTRIVVFDLDTKLKTVLEKANEKYKLDIEFVEHDFRNPIPEEFRGQFDCFLTDPPYTRNGVKLFISRGIDLLKTGENSVCYFSFGTKPPEELLEIQIDLSQMNCLITDILPGFNEYIGAQKLGGVSTLYRLLIAPFAEPLIKDRFEKQLYTGESNPIIRYYVCGNCKKQFEVGQNCDFITIEQLKKNKCPYCNHENFKKISEKKIE